MSGAGVNGADVNGADVNGAGVNGVRVNDARMNDAGSVDMKGEGGRMDSDRRLRIAVFASGAGSIFQAIMEKVAAGELSVNVELLVCDCRKRRSWIRRVSTGCRRSSSVLKITLLAKRMNGKFCRS